MVANVPPRALTPALWSQPSNFKATGNFSFIALKLGDAARPARVYCRVRPASRNHGSFLRLFILKHFQSIHSFLGSTPYFSQRFTKTEEKSKYSDHKTYAYIFTNKLSTFVRQILFIVINIKFPSVSKKVLPNDAKFNVPPVIFDPLNWRANTVTNITTWKKFWQPL